MITYENFAYQGLRGNFHIVFMGKMSSSVSLSYNENYDDMLFIYK